MRVIEVTEITLPNTDHFTQESRYYGIRLGNGFTVHFTSKRNAEKFASATKQFLTDCLIELNDIYIECWTHYRKNWFYFSGRNEENMKSMLKIEKQVVTELNTVERCFSQISRLNDNLQPWKCISEALLSVLKICDHLIEVRRKRNEYVERKSVEILKKRVILLISEMSGFGSSQKHSYEVINQLFIVRDQIPQSRLF